MKILRIRRGFTTNSSASTEWIPPPTPANSSATSGQASLTTPAPSTPGTTAANSQLATNTLTISGIVLAIASAFLVERLLRRILRRKHHAEEADRNDPDE